MWSRNVDISDTLPTDLDTAGHSSSQLFHLNLAHNNFSSVPVSLACLAVNLSRLNLSFNKYDLKLLFSKILSCETDDFSFLD